MVLDVAADVAVLVDAVVLEAPVGRLDLLLNARPS